MTGPVFPEDCLLSREYKGVFFDTRSPDEFPCEGCPRMDCEVKERITTACILGKDIEEDFHSINCNRCGARMFAWTISGKSRTWICTALVEGEFDSTWKCGWTYTQRVALAEW